MQKFLQSKNLFEPEKTTKVIMVAENLPISCRTLDELFGDSLTSSLCVSSHRDTKMWVVTGMLAHHLESFTDSVVVRNSLEKEEQFGDKIIGIVGGKEIIENVFLSPHSNLFDKTNVEEVMYKKLATVTKQSKLSELLENWKQTQRAFAIIPNELNDYSALSAKKLLEIGMKVKTDMSISELPKKKIVTFQKDAQIGEIMNLMLENKTRKLVLEDTCEFISDRIIVGQIAEDLKFLREIENFLFLPVQNFKLTKAQTFQNNLTLSEASEIMYKMEHPYLIFQDYVISPYDVCMALFSEELTDYELT